MSGAAEDDAAAPSRAVVVSGLMSDLAAEHADLARLLQDRPQSVWATPTPAPGWSVHDQIAHLAHVDALARLAVTDPVGFATMRAAMPDPQADLDAVGARSAHLSGEQMLAWWEREHRGLHQGVLAADLRTRVPWFGPPMSLASAVTARLMETWAHGQDVADALGVIRAPTDRLRSVARLGVLTFAHSFRSHDLTVPGTGVRVSLHAPEGGADWRWHAGALDGAGDRSEPSGSGDSVCGDALDFCQVVTRRRHVDDTGLTVCGPVARAWMLVAQAYAGAPGPGRRSAG